LILTSGSVTLLGIDYNVLCCFLVYLVSNATHVGALAIMVIQLSCISLVIHYMVSSSTFWSINSWPPIDVRP